MSKKSIQSRSGQVFNSVLSKEAGSKSKKTALLSKKIMLTLALGACFFAVQNPVMAEEVTITGKDMLPELAASGTEGKMSVCGTGNNTYNYYATNAGDKVIIDTAEDLSFIKGRDLVRFVGRYSDSETVSSNEITLKNGKVNQLYGGCAYDQDVIGNIVNVKGGDVRTFVGGGSVSGSSGNVKKNVVNVYDGKIDGRVFGGWSESDNGVVADNVVNVHGGEIYGEVCGGMADINADVTGNKININDGTFFGNIYGGKAKGAVTGNEVHISGGTIGDETPNADLSGLYIYGAFGAGSRDVSNNLVSITGGKNLGGVIGACSQLGNVVGNTVKISGADTSVEQTIYGGVALGLDMSYNMLSDDMSSDDGSAEGITSTYNASNNTVNISSGKISYDVYGGISFKGNAESNEVTISGGEISGEVFGGTAPNGSAINNTVNISGGTVDGNVTGGFSNRSTADNNTVNISGGSVNGNVAGGRSYVSASNNTVNLSGGAITEAVIGGYSDNLSCSITGNTLNVKGLDIKAGNIFKFDNINFFIPSSATDGSTMLTLTGVTLLDPDELSTLPSELVECIKAINTNDTDISKANVKAGVVAIEGDSKLKVGDTVTLIENEVGQLITADENGTEMPYGKLTAQEGVSVKYEFDIEKKGENALIATIKAVPVASGLEPQTKSLVETQAAGMAMLNGGMDMLAGEGIANAIAAAADASGAAAGAGEGAGSSAASGSSAGDGASAGADSSAGEGSDGAVSDGAGSDGVSGKGAVGADAGREFAMFGMLGASDMKYKTGSHVDLDGWNIGLGFAKTVENNAGKLTFGPVISYGKGSYDSYLDDGIHGEGDSDYLGISLFVHQANKDGVYYEGSIGAGRVSNDYSSNDLVDAYGAKVHEKYDTDSTFVAAHLGIGKKLEVSDKAKLDVYGKYFYAHQGGDDAKLATGETYHFDAVDSNRIRVGARYEVENNAVTTTYVGTAYEYEFSGDAKATYKGMETPSPSLKGSSGMLELGWKVKPSAASPLTIDLSANGWCGQKEGYGVKANFLWTF